MTKTISRISPAAGILVLLVIPGCLGRYRTSPVEVTLTRGAAEQPVAGARVRIEYPDRDLLTAPPPTEGVTNGEGKVRLPIADLETATLTVTSKESDYPSFQETFPLNRQLIREGGRLQTNGSTKPVSATAEPPLQMRLENHRWVPWFVARLQQKSREEQNPASEPEMAVVEETQADPPVHTASRPDRP